MAAPTRLLTLSLRANVTLVLDVLSGVGYTIYFFYLIGDPPWPSGYDAWFPSVNSQVRVSDGYPSGLAWSLYKCAALWRPGGLSMVLLQLKDPLVLFVKSRELLLGSGFLSRRDMT